VAESVTCRGCGRRLTLPERIDRAKARCPKCRTKVQSRPAPAAPAEPDAYQVYVSESQAIPKPDVLSLDDAPPADPKPAPPPTPPPVEHFPPPFRVPVEVQADTLRHFAGPMHAVLTPFGVFLESEPNRPLMFVPVGCRGVSAGRALDLQLPGRRIVLQLAGVHDPSQLSADTAAFLGGERPVPLPAEYRPPWWLVGVGAIFAVGLASGPVMLAMRSEALSLGPAAALSLAFLVVALIANGLLALTARLATGMKIGAMAIVNGGALALFVAGAIAFLDDTEPPPAPSSPPQSPIEGDPPPSPVPPEPPQPVTFADFLQRDGVVRYEDGPADVTAMAPLPGGSALIAYADGSTRVWQFDQPVYEPARLGPKAPSAIRRIAFDDTGKQARFTCDTGLLFANWSQPNRPATMIPGERVVPHFAPNRDRFAAIRDDRIHVRYLPMELLKNPDPNRVRNGLVVSTSRDETIPLGGTAAGLAATGGKPTFLAWTAAGRLVAGREDGAIATLPGFGPAGPAFLSFEHRVAVRTWEQFPNGDFVFGDDDGFVSFWANGSTRITKFRTGGVAIRSLSFSFCGGEVAVVDAAGWLSLWAPETGRKRFEVKQTQKTTLAAFGPHDVLLVAAGRGVEAWLLSELERLAGK